MIELSELQQLGPSVWEVPKGTRPGMRCAPRIYVNGDSLHRLKSEKSLEQLVNVSMLPGVEHAFAMPDIHQGYGFPIGGVAAIRADTGVISPGGVGYDIDCGVRVLTSPYRFEEVRDHLRPLALQTQRDVPSGLGNKGGHPLAAKELNQVLQDGCKWAVANGIGRAEDLETIEESGAYRFADHDLVSKEAKQRGIDQLGTIGSGNHFVEIQRVTEIFNREVASTFNLVEDQIVVMIHTGSRGLGHQVCTDYVRLMNSVRSKYNIELPDRELSCAPFRSKEGQSYFKAMASAANFAWTNRQVITHRIRKAWRRVLNDDRAEDLSVLYDVAHNIAKLETHDDVEYIVHRKGATRAFGPGSSEIPRRYRAVGQPVLIPGSMGTFSFILSGTTKGMKETLGSSCHGAGRALSRTKAKETIDYNQLRRELEEYGVVVCAGSAKGLLEEAPKAYKNVDEVVDVIDKEGVGSLVARLRPVAVIKG